MNGNCNCVFNLFLLALFCVVKTWNCGGFRIKIMYYHFNERSGLKAPLIADDVYEIIMKVLFMHFRDKLLYVPLLLCVHGSN